MELKKVAKFSAVVTLCLLPIIPLAVPYVFTSGSPISAAQMNANFAALEAEVAAAGLVWGAATSHRASRETPRRG
jgi:hypothetical protein